MKLCRSPPGAHRETPLAHRARLPRIETGDRFRRFRRQRFGEAFAFTPPCALPLLPSWCPIEPLFPLASALRHDHRSPCLSRRSPTTRCCSVRTERHVPDSIATLRRTLVVGIAATLDQCSCCAHARSVRKSRGQVCRSRTNYQFEMRAVPVLPSSRTQRIYCPACRNLRQWVSLSSQTFQRWHRRPWATHH